MYFSLNLRPPCEFSLGFGTIKASFLALYQAATGGFSSMRSYSSYSWGNIFHISASLPEMSLEARHPREFSLGFGNIKASTWRCSGLPPGSSPAFDRTEYWGNCFHIRQPSRAVSGSAIPPREFSLGFGSIKASSWRCSGLLPGVSPVFDRTETVLGEIFTTFASLPELSLEAPPPPVSSLSRVRYHQGIFLVL